MSNETGVPPAAQLLRDFINTREPQVGREALTSADELHAWFADRALVAADAALRPSDVAIAVTRPRRAARRPAWAQRTAQRHQGPRYFE
jgi:hypothetical protein